MSFMVSSLGKVIYSPLVDTKTNPKYPFRFEDPLVSLHLHNLAQCACKAAPLKMYTALYECSIQRIHKCLLE